MKPLPLRRSDLRIEPYGSSREHVVKDPRTGAFFLLGEQEHFLLLQLDGRCDSSSVRAEFERRKVNGEQWLPARASYTASARVFLVRRLRIGGTSEFSDYRKFTVATETTLAKPGGQE